MMTPPPNPQHQFANPGRKTGRLTLLVLGIDEAFRVIRTDAEVHVHAFTHDWGVIDRARALAAAGGVSHRLSIHHQGALSSLRRAS